jgi:hypothetical protein
MVVACSLHAKATGCNPFLRAEKEAQEMPFQRPVASPVWTFPVSLAVGRIVLCPKTRLYSSKLSGWLGRHVPPVSSDFENDNDEGDETDNGLLKTDYCLVALVLRSGGVVIHIIGIIRLRRFLPCRFSFEELS